MRCNSTPITIANTVQSVVTQTLDLQYMYGWDATIKITDNTPTAKTFVPATGNNFTTTAHGYTTGLKIQVSTSGTLPSPLITSTNYYVIVIDANTFALATTLAHALIGTAIAIDNTSTMPTNTVTPQALAGSVTVQKLDTSLTIPSLSAPAPFTITIPTTAASQNISATTLNYYDIQAMYNGMYFTFNVTSGAASATINFNAKG